MPELILPDEAEARLAFARQAVDHFAAHPNHWTFGSTNEGQLFATRWGLLPDRPNAVLVLEIRQSWIYGDMDEDRTWRLRKGVKETS